MTALKLGTSESSEAIAVTHTASLVGDDAAYGALFARLGVHRVRQRCPNCSTRWPCWARSDR